LIEFIYAKWGGKGRTLPCFDCALSGLMITCIANLFQRRDEILANADDV